MSTPTRHLPAAPNLEHLRKQAKDLQRDHQAGDPDAITRIRAALPKHSDDDAIAAIARTDAQFVIAREYGFASWPLLAKAVAMPVEQVERLKAAIETGAADTIEDLLGQHLHLITREFEWTDRKGRRRNIDPIRYAHACDQQPSVDALLTAGANLDFLRGSLWSNLYNRNMPEVKRLLARGVDTRNTWLVSSGGSGRERNAFVNVLIEAGADYEDGPYADIHRGHLHALELRLQADPFLVHHIHKDRSHAIPTSGTLLHVAAAHNDLEFIELLLQHGADIDAIGPIHSDDSGREFEVIYDGTGGQTPIYYTIGRSFGCCYEAFERLLHQGPDLGVRAGCLVEGEIRQVTPLGYALARQKFRCIEDGALHREQLETYREIDRLRELGAPE